MEDKTWTLIQACIWKLIASTQAARKDPPRSKPALVQSTVKHAGLEPRGGFTPLQQPCHGPRRQRKGRFAGSQAFFKGGAKQGGGGGGGGEKPMTNLVTFPFSV